MFRTDRREMSKGEAQPLLGNEDEENVEPVDDDFSSQFFQRIEGIKKVFSQIDGYSDEIEEDGNRLLSTGAGWSQKQLESKLKLGNEACNRARNEIVAVRKEAAQNRGDAEGRMRDNMVLQTTRKLQTTLERFQTVQTRYRDVSEKVMTRQLKIVKPGASEQKIKKAVTSGEVQNLFAEAAKGSAAHERAKLSLMFVQEQHREIQLLEKSVVELLGLFQDVAVMIDQQQHDLDNIESNVRQAVHKTTETLSILKDTERNVINHRWRVFYCLCGTCCCLFWLTFIFFAIIIFIIVDNKQGWYPFGDGSFRAWWCNLVKGSQFLYNLHCTNVSIFPVNTTNTTR